MGSFYGEMRREDRSRKRERRDAMDVSGSVATRPSLTLPALEIKNPQAATSGLGEHGVNETPCGSGRLRRPWHGRAGRVVSSGGCDGSGRWWEALFAFASPF